MQTRKLAQLKQYIESADLALQQARGVLAELGGDKVSDKLAKSKAQSLASITDESTHEKVIEGIFNGQNMIGSDGKEYSVPANYASKSKLVEGDELKLTIQEDGSFIYKQIRPVERERLKGEVVMDKVTGKYAILTPDGKRFNVLTASVTYFKGGVGDQAVILVPKNKIAGWAAIENIFKEGSEKVQEISGEKRLDQDEIKTENKNLDKEQNSVIELGEIEKDYQGITQHAQHESTLPLENSGLTNNRRVEKSEQERQKIQTMINKDNLRIDDLDREDLEDL